MPAAIPRGAAGGADHALFPREPHQQIVPGCEPDQLRHGGVVRVDPPIWGWTLPAPGRKRGTAMLSAPVSRGVRIAVSTPGTAHRSRAAEEQNSQLRGSPDRPAAAGPECHPGRALGRFFTLVRLITLPAEPDAQRTICPASTSSFSTSVTISVRPIRRTASLPPDQSPRRPSRASSPPDRAFAHWLRVFGHARMMTTGRSPGPSQRHHQDRP